MEKITASNPTYPTSAQGSGPDLFTHSPTRHSSRRRHKELLSLGLGSCSCKCSFFFLVSLYILFSLHVLLLHVTTWGGECRSCTQLLPAHRLGFSGCRTPTSPTPFLPTVYEDRRQTLHRVNYGFKMLSTSFHSFERKNEAPYFPFFSALMQMLSLAALSSTVLFPQDSFKHFSVYLFFSKPSFKIRNIHPIFPRHVLFLHPEIHLTLCSENFRNSG